MPKIAAATNSFGTPAIRLPSNSVSSTTTSSGTSTIRAMVRLFGKFMNPGTFGFYSKIEVCHEGDPSRWRKGHAAASPHHPHTQTNRSHLQSPVSALPDRPAQTGAGNRRGDPQPQLSAPAHRGDLR